MDDNFGVLRRFFIGPPDLALLQKKWRFKGILCDLLHRPPARKLGAMTEL